MGMCGSDSSGSEQVVVVMMQERTQLCCVWYSLPTACMAQGRSAPSIRSTAAQLAGRQVGPRRSLVLLRLMCCGQALVALHLLEEALLPARLQGCHGAAVLGLQGLEGGVVVRHLQEREGGGEWLIG